MRKLVYELKNGTVVNTLADAKASGQTYVMKCVDVVTPNRRKLHPELYKK